MRNPARRSRKIGLTQGGRIRDGRPLEKRSRAFPEDLWKQLSSPSPSVRVIVENPSRDYFHPCEPSDYLGLIARLPPSLSDPLRTIVLRRLCRRDERACTEARRRFSCILLNAFPRSLELPWMRPPTEAEIRHFAPWCTNWQESDEGWTLIWSLDAIRTYYAYHLFLHELGHLHHPPTYTIRRAESFAENFALEWARRLGVGA